MTDEAGALTLYGFQRSTYVNVVRLVLHAKGVRFHFHDTETEMYSAAHDTRHPFGRVPVLQHGNFWLYETSAIALYIEDRFGGPRLLPNDVRQRAIAHQWMSSLSAYFYPCVIFSLVHERLVFGDLGIRADEDVIAESLPKIVRCLEVMRATLESTRYLVGDEVTMADYFLLPTMTALTFVPEGNHLLTDFPSVSAWLQRMATLPAVQAVRASLPVAAPIEHARRWATDHRARPAGR